MFIIRNKNFTELIGMNIMYQYMHLDMEEAGKMCAMSHKIHIFDYPKWVGR